MVPLADVVLREPEISVPIVAMTVQETISVLLLVLGERCLMVVQMLVFQDLLVPEVLRHMEV